VLRVKFELGLFDQPYVDASKAPEIIHTPVGINNSPVQESVVIQSPAVVIPEPIESTITYQEHTTPTEPIIQQSVETIPEGEPFYIEQPSTDQYEIVQATPQSEVTYNQPEVLHSSRTHKVQKGDTLYSLSKRYNVDIQTIRKINGIAQNTIKVGQTIKLDY